MEVYVYGLAGGFLTRIVREYYHNILSGRLESNAKIEAKKELIFKILGDGDFGGMLEDSLKFAREMMDNLASSLMDAGYSVGRLDFVLLDRGLVGSGSGVFKTVFEVGMEIDKLLGLPYYPGSSLKGAARAVCEDLISDEHDEPSDSSSDSKEDDVCDKLFGSKEMVAPLVYTSAYPIGCIEDLGPCTVYLPDVITPHYYRDGKVVEAEHEAQPNPVVHLSISPGTVFSTIVGVYSHRLESVDREARRILEEFSKYDSSLKEQLDASPADAVMRAGLLLLEVALMTGIGARTGKGYNTAKPLNDGRKRLSVEVVRLSFQWPSRG